MKKPQFVNGQIYHIYNRGVEKRDIFIDDSDYSYAVHNLFVLNNKNPFLNTSRGFLFSHQSSGLMEVGLPSINIGGKRKNENREPLVEIFVFALMPNHYHLMLRQLVDGGIVKFMQKFGTSTTKRFNEKYSRVGPLFQGRFKAVLVEKDAHFLYLPYYIHINPTSLIDGSPTSINWKEKMEFLENYRWSSFQDYIGKKNFPSVIQKDFLMKSFGSEKKYREDMADWLKEDSNAEMGRVKDILLD